MNNLVFIIIFAVIIVAFFVVGMSLTLIFKGHHIESEIGDNPNMKKRGIKCASQQMREDERARGWGANSDKDDCLSCSDANCSSCSH